MKHLKHKPSKKHGPLKAKGKPKAVAPKPRPSRKLLAPGWAGELADDELAHIHAGLQKSASLSLSWGFHPDQKTRSPAAIRRVAMHGTPEDAELNRRLALRGSAKTRSDPRRERKRKAMPKKGKAAPLRRAVPVKKAVPAAKSESKVVPNKRKAVANKRKVVPKKREVPTTKPKRKPQQLAFDFYEKQAGASPRTSPAMNRSTFNAVS